MNQQWLWASIFHQIIIFIIPIPVLANMTYQCLLQRIKSVIRIIFLWVLCNGIFIPSGYGQSTKMIDSLRQAFRLEQDPIKKSDIYYDLAFELENQDLELILLMLIRLKRCQRNPYIWKGQPELIVLGVLPKWKRQLWFCYCYLPPRAAATDSNERFAWNRQGV